MIKAHHKYPQKANMVKEHKSHKRALRFQAGMELRYYPLSVQLVKTCPKNSNRVLEDLNITDYPRSVIIPV